MNKTERLYAFTLGRQVVTSKDLALWSRENLSKDYKYLYSKYITRLLAQGKLVRICRGIYAAVNVYASGFLDNPSILPNSYLIGSKLRDDYYLAYHTALELHGCAYSVTNDTYVAVPDRGKFRPFSHDPLRFFCVVSRDTSTEVMVRRIAGHDVRVSSPSRTFVECVRRPDICGGLEEVLKSLDGLRGVTQEGLDASMAVYGYDILYRSIGFFLELMRRESPFYDAITSEYIETIRSRTGATHRYLLEGVGSELDERWGLYVPRGLHDVLVGVK